MQTQSSMAATMMTSNKPLSAEFVDVTPEMAREWLKLNTANYRLLNQRWVRAMAEDMRNGRWQENGESIKFGLTGDLVDGQHRLAAGVLANVSFRTLVVHGVAADTNIDTGHRRDLKDLLRRNGEKHYKTLASALRWVRGYETDQLRTVIGPGVAPTHQEMLAVLARNPAIRDSLTPGRSAYELVSGPLAVGFHFIFSQRSDRQTADLFFEKLISGTDLSAVDPVYHLRQRLIKNQTAKAKLGRAEIAALFVKAWNAWINGRPITLLRWRSVGPTAEEFPAFE